MRKNIVFILGSLFLVAAYVVSFTAPVSAADTMASVDAKALFAAKCAGCHGADAAKLKGNSAGYLMNALYGYKAKTYGGAKKEIMEARAAQLSSDEVQALAAHLSGL